MDGQVDITLPSSPTESIMMVRFSTEGFTVGALCRAKFSPCLGMGFAERS